MGFRCRFCGEEFRSGAGLASHERACGNNGLIQQKGTYDIQRGLGIYGKGRKGI